MPNKFDEMNTRNALRRRVAGEQPPSPASLMRGMVEPEPDIIEKIVEVAPEGAIVRRDDGAMVYKRFVMTATGMEIPADCDGEEWKDVGAVVKGLDTSIAWNIGDWAVYAIETWEMTAGQIAEMFGYETTTIEGYVSVCRAIHGMVRHQALSFDVHRPVAKLEQDKQIYWLGQAVANGWDKKRLQAAINPKPGTDPIPPQAKQAAQYGGAINKALPNLQALDDKRRRQVAEKADWLAQYYADIARRARGE